MSQVPIELSPPPPPPHARMGGGGGGEIAQLIRPSSCSRAVSVE